MTDSSKEVFLSGLFLGILLATIVVVSVPMHETSPPLHLESTLPKNCTTGEKVIVTTPTPVEFYVCEAVWKRR
jgi:hypothetical protein